MDEIERDQFGKVLNGACPSTTSGGPPPRVGEELEAVPLRGCPSTVFDGPPPPAGEERRRTSRVRRVDLVEESALEFVPFVHVAPRRNSITPDKQRRFIATLAATGIVSQAALSIGASVEALYKLRHRVGAEDFARAWDAAVERGYSRLEDCALERAIAGEERPVVSRGKVVATWTHHNTGLLMFLLRARRPEKYGAVRVGDLRPGHPVYDALKVQWERERAAADVVEAEAVRRSLHGRLLEMRERVLAQREGEALRQAQGERGFVGERGLRESAQGERPFDGLRMNGVEGEAETEPAEGAPGEAGGLC